jgi:UDP-glucose 4-epimerase
MPLNLVTGGAGFIGSHIAEALVQRGEHVRVLDDFSAGSRDNLRGLEGEVEIIESDLRNAGAVSRAVDGVDVIFHQAAFVSVPASMENPELCYQVNIGGTVNVLEAARLAGVKRIVIASSAAVYGNSDSLPLPEKTPLKPLSPYAISKRMGEMLIEFYARVYALSVVALRYFNVYGPRQSPDSQYAAAIPIFIRCLLADEPVTIFGDGKQARDFIFIGDVVRANLLAADSPDAAGKAYNICTGRETTLLDLQETLDGIIPNGKPPQFAAPREGDIFRSLGDPRLAKAAFGFEAQTGLAEGLQATADWMKA